MDDVHLRVVQGRVEVAGRPWRRPRRVAAASASSGLASMTPRTFTPSRRRASMWTVPMKPLPMTAAPMSLKRSTDPSSSGNDEAI